MNRTEQVKPIINRLEDATVDIQKLIEDAETELSEKGDAMSDSEYSKLEDFIGYLSGANDDLETAIDELQSIEDEEEDNRAS